MAYYAPFMLYLCSIYASVIVPYLWPIYASVIMPHLIRSYSILFHTSFILQMFFKYCENLIV